jgi:hypothetical protein
MAWGIRDGKAASGVARPQGVEGSGIAGPSETLGSLWIPLAIRPCHLDDLPFHGFAGSRFGDESLAYHIRTVGRGD